MDLKRIKRIITLAKGTDIEEIEFKDNSTQFKLRFEVKNHQAQHLDAEVKAHSSDVPEIDETNEAHTPPSPPPTEMKTDRTVTVRSSMVGRCYLVPPDDNEAEPYVIPGGYIRMGQILAVIKAMGIRNEYNSNYDGIVTGLFVDNGQAVEYGQPLLTIEIE